jgi:uncharacterized protein with NRDE domain
VTAVTTLKPDRSVLASVCTLVLAWQVFPDAPVVAAATRDEQLDRPSEPPAERDWARPAVAPVDGSAGGTWIGYNDAGVFTAITNRWTAADLAGDRSRGLLVRDVLGESTAENGARRVERAVESHEYEGFNLVVADETAAVYLEWDGGLDVRNFEPGVHVVVNVGADGRYVVGGQRADHAETQGLNADAVRTALQPEPGEASRAWLDRAAAVIADHDFGVCIHGDGYGTRSASLVRLRPDGREYEFAAGPPCETVFEPVAIGL